jgi:hypothetical protein
MPRRRRSPSARSATPISTTLSSDRPVNGSVPPEDGVVGVAATELGGLNCCVVGADVVVPGVDVEVVGVDVDVVVVDTAGAAVDVVGGVTTVVVWY